MLTGIYLYVGINRVLDSKNMYCIYIRRLFIYSNGPNDSNFNRGCIINNVVYKDVLDILNNIYQLLWILKSDHIYIYLYISYNLFLILFLLYFQMYQRTLIKTHLTHENTNCKKVTSLCYTKYFCMLISQITCFFYQYFFIILIFVN